MKDINFLLAAEANPNFISLSDPDRVKLLRVVKSYADFLASQGLMDYSLLVGIKL